METQFYPTSEYIFLSPKYVNVADVSVAALFRGEAHVTA